MSRHCDGGWRDDSRDLEVVDRSIYTGEVSKASSYVDSEVSSEKL
jgi:hypothetical protein